MCGGRGEVKAGRETQKESKKRNLSQRDSISHLLDRRGGLVLLFSSFQFVFCFRLVRPAVWPRGSAVGGRGVCGDVSVGVPWSFRKATRQDGPRTSPCPLAGGREHIQLKDLSGGKTLCPKLLIKNDFRTLGNWKQPNNFPNLGGKGVQEL